MSLAFLAETAGYIILRFLVAGVGKDLAGFIIFDQLPYVKKGGFIADAGGLLHVVSYDHNCVLAFERMHQFFDLLRGNRRSEEHTSELQSLMRISYAVFCLK